MYFIINNRMSDILKSNDINQYFGDATYRALPPTMRNYKLYIISGFNLIEKRTRIGAFILIPNETETTYYNMFYNLKNNHGFKPKFFTLDFNKASSKAIKEIFPNIFIIKCFYHYIQAIWRNLKKYKLYANENKSEIIELAFNLKRLCFINPKNIPILYKKIEQKYSANEYKKFFQYFRRTWNPKCIYKKLKIIPEWNYYFILKKLEIDVKNLFLTNNIAEHLNKILNSKLKSKFPIFMNWREAILNTEKEVNLKFEETSRQDFSSKILFYYINFIKNNEDNTDLLNNEEIIKLSSLFTSGIKTNSIFSLSEIIKIAISENNMINEDISKIEDMGLESENDLNSEDIDNNNNEEDDINNNDELNTSDSNEINNEDNNLFVIFKNNKIFK